MRAVLTVIPPRLAIPGTTSGASASASASREAGRANGRAQDGIGRVWHLSRYVNWSNTDNGVGVLGLALIDQDGVVADFERGVLDAFRAAHPGAPFIELADRRVFYAREQYAEQFGSDWGRAINAITRHADFYRNLPVIAGAPEALREMREAGHEVFLCTSPLTSSRWCVPEKLAWVENHLGASWLDRIIIAKDKTLVGDRLRQCILVDDRPVIRGLADPPPWTHVLFDAPYNRNQAEQRPRLSCWSDWRSALRPYLDGH